MQHRTSRPRVYVVLVALMVAGAFAPALGARTVANVGFLRLLGAAAPPQMALSGACNAEDEAGCLAPAAQVEGFAARIQDAQQWPGAPVVLDEYLLVLSMLQRDYDGAARRYEELLSAGALRAGLWGDGRAGVHLMLSHAHEAEGDLRAALLEQEASIAAQNDVLLAPPPGDQLRRRCALYGRLAREGQAGPQDLERAMRCAACLADWDSALEQASRVAQSPDVPPEARAFAAHLAGLLRRKMGNEYPAGEVSLVDSAIPVDMWSLGDATLWLARSLDQGDWPCCYAGPAEMYRWYSEDNPSRGQGLYLQGVLELARGDPTQAIAYLNQALGREPQHVAALRAMGVAYESMGDYASSSQWYMAALEAWPDNPEYHARLARVLDLQGQRTEAERHYDLAVSLHAEPALLLWAANFYAANEACAKAVPIYASLAQDSGALGAAAMRGLAQCEAQ